jgi:hypothetical protein
VEAGHENEIHFGNATHHLGAHGHDAAQPGSHREPLVLLAVDLTGEAADAFGAVVKQVIFAHGLISVFLFAEIA